MNKQKYSYQFMLRMFFTSLLFICFLFSQNIYSAEPTPLLNSISMDQKKRYMESLPRGTDVPQKNPLVMLPGSQYQSTGSQSEIEKNIAEKLKSISLEEKIQQQSIQPKLEQFGYNLFSNVPTTYAPVTNIPVPPGYMIGPGDTIIIQLYGKTNVEYKLVVTREGKILIPDIGPVTVSGLSFSEVKKKINNQINEKIFGTTTAITMGELRTINVMILGEVINPGSYTVSGLSDLLNVIMSSGGIKRTGSLRKIQHKRNNKVLSTFDLYDVLLNGSSQQTYKIAHGDIIFVPPIGKTVAIGGEVVRPAIYELKNNYSLGNLIKIAGGLLPTASIEASHIERIKDGQYLTLVSLSNSKKKLNNISVQAGDLVRIFPVKKIIDDVVLLSGHVIQPAGYQYKKNMRVSDILYSAKQLLQNADTDIAILRRENEKLKKIEIKYIKLNRILNNYDVKYDLLLKERDEIIVFNQLESRNKKLQSLIKDLKTQSTPSYPPMMFTVMGHIRHSGTFPLQRGSRLLDVINIAGGIQAGTDMKYALIARKRYPSNELEMFSIDLNLAKEYTESEWNTLIHPEDIIYLFNKSIDRNELIKEHISELKAQTAYGEFAPIVSIDGLVKNSGTYPLEPGMRVSKLIKASAGLVESSYGIDAELTRYKLIDGQYQVSEQKIIKLDDILAGQGLSDLVLNPGDHLAILKKPQWTDKQFIELAGEIKFPGRYPINHKETLCNVIQRAGGLTNKAYPYGSVFTREAVRQKQQKSLDRVQGELDDLLVKLHLSPSLKNDEKMAANDEMHEIDKVINKLKQAKATGRMVINMDKVLACDENADIILEGGDKLSVPALAYDISVMGEVFYPGTHSYVKDRGSQDYIDLSGGVTDLGKNKFAYVVQANGEVNSVREYGWFAGFKNIKVQPGATIYVPIDVDRSNTTENLQSWAEIIFKLTLSAAGVGAIL